MSSIETENQLSYCGSIIDIFCKEMRADKDRFSNKPTLSAFLSDKPTLSADNVGFFRETYFIWKKPSDNVSFFFQKNPLYLRQTYIIWSDNVSFLDKSTLSADSWVFFFRKNLVYQTEKPTLSEINRLCLIIATTACHRWARGGLGFVQSLAFVFEYLN